MSVDGKKQDEIFIFFYFFILIYDKRISVFVLCKKKITNKIVRMMVSTRFFFLTQFFLFCFLLFSIMSSNINCCAIISRWKCFCCWYHRFLSLNHRLSSLFSHIFFPVFLFVFFFELNYKFFIFH